MDFIGRSTWKSISGVLIGNIEQFGWPTRAPEIKDPSEGVQEGEMVAKKILRKNRVSSF